MLRTFIDRHWVWLGGAVAAAVLYLNRDADGLQGGLQPYFLDLADVIRAGFDPGAAARRGVATFPMWGYAWLLALTQNRVVLMAVQGALALLGGACLVRTLAQRRLLGFDALTLLRALLVVSIPWYAFHAIRWEAGILASLVLLASVVLLQALTEPDRPSGKLALAGLLFGLAANFRSDMLLLPGLLAPFAAFGRRGGGGEHRLSRALVWLIAAYAPLLPWGIYTHHITGRPLLTSTNGGLVALIGFGVVPDNPWDITTSDDDPVVRNLLSAHFGRATCPVTAEADRLLKAEFVNCVRAAPAVYLRRVLRTLADQITAGIYPGEFYRLALATQHEPLDGYRQLRAELARNPFEFVGARPGPAAALALQFAASLFGRVVVCLSFLCLPLTLVYALVRRQWWHFCYQAPLVYKTALVALLAWAEPRFTTPVYPFHLVNLAVAAGLLHQWLAPTAGPRRSTPMLPPSAKADRTALGSAGCP